MNKLGLGTALQKPDCFKLTNDQSHENTTSRLICGSEMNVLIQKYTKQSNTKTGKLIASDLPQNQVLVQNQCWIWYSPCC